MLDSWANMRSVAFNTPAARYIREDKHEFQWFHNRTGPNTPGRTLQKELGNGVNQQRRLAASVIGSKRHGLFPACRLISDLRDFVEPSPHLLMPCGVWNPSHPSGVGSRKR